MSFDNDPWGKNPKNTQGNELVKFFESLKSTFFGENNSSGSNGSNPNTPQSIPKKLVAAIAGLVLIVWAGTGIYILPEGFNAVELTFGRYTETATQPGLNFRKPYPIGSIIKVDVGSLNNLTVGNGNRDSEGQMLTSDENIVEVSLSVQYKISQPEKYLFSVDDPEKVLKETFVSSIREVVGGNNVDYVLTDGRAEWPALVKEDLIKVLKGFDIGFEIARVELKEAKAPKEVQEAFDDAVKAREDAEKLKLEAEAYQNQKVPLARGQAQVIIQRANGQKVSIVDKATGEAEYFNQLLKSYQQAPEVTKQRMYIETMEKLYGQVNNIIVDTGDNSPILYIPAGTGENPPLPAPNLIEDQQIFGDEIDPTKIPSYLPKNLPKIKLKERLVR